jgi:hypothetical protein
MAPGYSVIEGMRIVRCAGPFVYGVALDRTSSGTDYDPIAHFHFLGFPFDCITLSFGRRFQSRNGAPSTIPVSFHEVRLSEAIHQLESAIPPLREDHLSADWLEWWGHELYSQPGGATELVSLLALPGMWAWCGNLQRRDQALDWLERAVVESSAQQWVDMQAVRARVESPETLRQTVIAEKQRHGLPNEEFPFRC